MSGYADSVELYEQALLSAGTTQKKFMLWQDGLEASLNSFKNSTEGLWLNLIDSGTIGKVVDLGTTVIQILDVMINKTDYLKVVLAGLSAIIVTKVISSMMTMQISAIKLGATVTLLTGGLNILIGILALATVGFGAFSYAQVEAERKKQEFIDTTKQNIEIAETEMAATEALKKKYEELKDKIGDTEEGKKKLNKIIEDLIRINPDLVDGINGQSISYNNLSEAIQLTINKTKELANVEKQSLADSFKNEMLKIADKKKNLLTIIEGPLAKEAGSLIGFPQYLKDDAKREFDQLTKRQSALLEEIKKLNTKDIFTEPDTSVDDEISAYTRSSTDGISKSAKEIAQYLSDDLAQAIDKVNGKLTASNVILARYEETSAEYRKEIEYQIGLQEQLQTLYHQGANELRARNEEIKASSLFQKDWNELGEEQKEELNALQKELESNIKAIEAFGGSWWGAQSAIESANKKLEDVNKTLADNAIKILKDSYKQQEKIRTESLRKELKDLEEAHKKRIEILDAELSKYEDIINARLQLIDRTEDEESFERELAKLQKERGETVRDINILAMDDSFEARAKLSDLNEKLTEQDEQIELLKDKRTRDLRKQNLQDDLNAKKKSVDTTKKAENDKLELERKRIEDTIEMEKWKYDQLINDEANFARMREEIIEGHVDEIQGKLTNFIEEFKRVNAEAAREIGISWQEVQNLIGEAEKTSSGLSPITTTKSDKATSSLSQYRNIINQIVYSKQQYKRGSEEGNQGLMSWASNNASKYYKQLPANIADMLRAMPYEEAKKWYDENVFHSGGIIGSSGNRVSDIINKFFNTKPNEYITKALKDEVIIKPQTFIPSMQKLISNIIPPKVATAGAGNIYNLNLKIDSVTGDKKGAEYLYKHLVKGIKSMGKTV